MRGEVTLQPCQLRLEIEHSAEDLRFLEAGIQDDDMPAAEVVAIPSGGLVVRGYAEVMEVSGPVRVALGVLVVAGGGVCALLELAPGRGIALRVVGHSACGIRVVAEREHGARDGVDDRGGPLRMLEEQGRPAFPDVTRPDKDFRRAGRDRKSVV